MSDKINKEMRNTIAEDNPYWIDKHRYYELRHFCMQYRTWKHFLNTLTTVHSSTPKINGEIHSNTYGDPVAEYAAKREKYSNLMKLVEETAYETDEVLAPYIITYVTENISFVCLNARERIPCCNVTFYKYVRKYLWLLSQKRG